MRKITILFIGVIVAMSFEGCSTSSYYKLPAAEFTAIDYGHEVRRIPVRNLEVACLDVGEGEETLLLIHGLGSNAKAWLRNLPDLARNNRVVAVDLPGYGHSSKGDYPYSLSFYATVLTELLDELGIERAVFIGHSLGGQIAMVTAIDHPERVSRLVLISPAGFEKFTPGEGQWFKEVMTVELVRDTPIRSIAENLKSNFHRTPSEANFMITDRIQVRGASDFEDYCYAVTKNVGAMIDEPVWDRLDAIAAPTLILFGENDALIPNPYLHGGRTADVAAIGEAGIQGSRLVMLPDCGHFVQFEKPAETNSAILEFLGDRRPGR